MIDPGPLKRYAQLFVRGIMIAVVAAGLVACGGEDEAAPTSNDPDTGPSIDQSPAAEESAPD